MATLIVKNPKGKVLAEFPANTNESLSAQLHSHNVPVQTACGVGACGVCMVKVKKGIEFLDEEAFGEKHVPLSGSDVLTCICGVKKSAGAKAEIILEVDIAR